jgi:hypothetical protein
MFRFSNRGVHFLGSSMGKVNPSPSIDVGARRILRSMLLTLLFVLANATTPAILSYIADKAIDELGLAIAVNITLSVLGIWFVFSEGATGFESLRRGRRVATIIHVAACSSVIASSFWNGDVPFLAQIFDLLLS